MLIVNFSTEVEFGNRISVRLYNQYNLRTERLFLVSIADKYVIVLYHHVHQRSLRLNEVVQLLCKSSLTSPPPTK